MTDEELDMFLRKIALNSHLGAAKSLLVGNDTQRFTTEQWSERIIAREGVDFPSRKKEDYIRPIVFADNPEFSRSCLIALVMKGYLKEVKRDVWAPGIRLWSNCEG